MKKRKKISTEQLFFSGFLAAVLIGLLLTVLAQRGGQVRTEVAEAPTTTPNFREVLPAGADMRHLKTYELVDAETPSYIAAYAVGGQGHVGLVSWDRVAGRFGLAATIELAAGSARLRGISTLTMERLGGGAPTLLMVQGPWSGAATEGVFVAARNGSELAIVEKTDTGGVGPAVFPVGASAKYTEELSTQDVDGDGDREILATTRENGSSDIRVYQWADGRLEYDKELSWGMTMDKKLFPEPAAEGATE